MTTVTDPYAFERKQLEKMLEERGISDPEVVLRDSAPEDFDAVRGTIRWWDDLPDSKKGTGLLVHRIQNGGMENYRRPGEREGFGDEDDPSIMSRTLLASVRRQLLTPDGMTWEVAEDHFRPVLRRFGTSFEALLEAVDLTGWVMTPPHPASLRSGFQGSGVRYEAHISAGARTHVADPVMRRVPGESMEAYSMRFWDWTDTDEMRERIARAVAERQEQMKAQLAKEAQEREAHEADAALAREAVENASIDPDDLFVEEEEDDGDS
jgi:hypothetical protein